MCQDLKVSFRREDQGWCESGWRERRGVIFFESSKSRFRPGVASNALGILIIYLDSLASLPLLCLK